MRKIIPGSLLPHDAIEASCIEQLVCEDCGVELNVWGTMARESYHATYCRYFGKNPYDNKPDERSIIEKLGIDPAAIRSGIKESSS